MGKQTKRNTIIFLLVLSIMLSACGAAEVQKENGAYVEETENEDSENAREEPKTEAVPEEQENDESITEEAKVKYRRMPKNIWNICLIIAPGQVADGGS